jgi:hypothetical protein
LVKNIITSYFPLDLFKEEDIHFYNAHLQKNDIIRSVKTIPLPKEGSLADDESVTTTQEPCKAAASSSLSPLTCSMHTLGACIVHTPTIVELHHYHSRVLAKTADFHNSSHVMEERSLPL